MCRLSVLGLKTPLLQLSEAKRKQVAHLNATWRSKLIILYIFFLLLKNKRTNVSVL